MLQQSLQQEQCGTGAAPGNDAAAAAQQQDGAHDGRGQQDARHVGLQHQQDQDRHQPQDGPDELHHDAVVDPLAQGHLAESDLRGPGGDVCREQDHLKLCHLGGLQGQAAEADPPAAAVDGAAEQHQYQQDQADNIAQLDHSAQEAVVKIGEQEHHAQAQHRAEQLGFDVMEAVPKAEIARGIACTEQHDQPEHHDDGQGRHPVEQDGRPGAGVPLKDGKRLCFFSAECCQTAPLLN